MMIPPFPSQDLAKLVLGYLAEEQLMTAYDEFLQASPYLDALRNEYDRIFMTSLKNILAEYRAVKIYVETCKPFILRKKLFQCTNLLEVVKFLIRHIDMNKILVQDSSTENVKLDCSNATSGLISSDAQKTATTSRLNECHLCISLKRMNCTCKNNSVNEQDSMQCASYKEPINLENLVQTTSLADLPGNKEGKPHMRVFEKDTTISQRDTKCQQNTVSTLKESKCVLNNSNSELSNNNCNLQLNSKLENASQHLLVNTSDKLELKQTTDEHNDILNEVTNNRLQTGNRSENNICEGTVDHKRVSTASTFQDFVSGVTGSNNTVIDVTVPDSSTSESLNVQSPVAKTSMNPNNNTIQRSIDTQLLLNVKEKEFEGKHEIMNLDTGNNESKSRSHNNLKFKSDENKITILSDIRVEKSFNSQGRNDRIHIRPPSMLKNATSTPLLQMQTIVINGTPAYKPKPQVENKCNFTKDEIMAMPTIILVPASGSSQIPSITQSQAVSTVPTFEPLTIDVSSNSSTLDEQNLENTNETTINTQRGTNKFNLVTNTETVGHVSVSNNTEVVKETSLVKTVEVAGNALLAKDITMTTSEVVGLVKTIAVTRNGSLPKDNDIIGNKTSTPQMLPPLRKSSSTPRRTSHIRTLDFTTPRRILHNTINEHVSGTKSPVEDMVNRSSNMLFLDSTIAENTIVDKSSSIKLESCNVKNGSTKENNNTNKIASNKRCNWDADLRALAVANERDFKPQSFQNTLSKSTYKTLNKKKTSENHSEKRARENDKTEEKNKKKGSPKTKSTKKKKRKVDQVAVENVKVIEKLVDVSIKPNINFITGNEWDTKPAPENKKSQNKFGNDEEVDTPEMDRISLQNAIGANLNISDLLETPYKQALYNIQMETPRFLGPDIPDDPMSDIKIMNIPTPRFLISPNIASTPKPVQTPSSYSSRPTDYSSGGSYYKPDDQDYVPVPEDLGCPLSSFSKGSKTGTVELPNKNENDGKGDTSNFKSSRPVRQCTKNVSYYNSTNVNKTSNTEDKSEVASSCSDTISINSSYETKNFKEISSKISSKVNKSKGPNKSEPKKRAISTKKPKSPIRKSTSSAFMKIKPRRSTPAKDYDAGKITKKKSESSQNISLKFQPRKRTSSKEKKLITPEAVPAPTKSRRKSSTPRKLHCTKAFNSDSFGNSEIVSKNKQGVTQNIGIACQQDSDTEPLRWSDDGSQDVKTNEPRVHAAVNESDDIIQIKEYIETTLSTKSIRNDNEGSLHLDLIKRGFDIETAKIIERDLLDTPPYVEKNKPIHTKSSETVEINNDKVSLERTTESDCTSNNLQIIQEEEYSEDIELSVYECTEDNENYFTVQHDDTKNLCNKHLSPLRDKFSMEVCIDDLSAIRLRATPFNILLDQDPQDDFYCNNRETEMAVNSISNMHKLYTPIKAQCYELFNSTLTSLDTPLKIDSPKRKQETTVAEIVLEVEQIIEKVENKDKAESKKRKRLQSGSISDESLKDSKRARPETQYLFNSANIQNIDIESVLSKLHGP